MSGKSDKFDEDLFELLICEFKKYFKIDCGGFNDYNKIREIINDETEEEELKRLDEKEGGRRRTKDPNKLSGYLIKRAFGFISYNGKHDQTTCSIIARKLKYDGWDDFCQKAKQKYDPKKGFNTLDMYSFNSLKINDNICIGWYPEKYSILKYQGEYTFKVIESYRLKSEIGRVFSTTGFFLGSTDSKCVYPDIIIEPFHDDDPDWELIDMNIIPVDYYL